MLRRALLILALATATVAAHADTPGWLPASPQKLPRWRGFNLTEKFMLHPGDSAFHEQDFQLISQFGVNYVRLPMDYRFWIRNGDGRQFDESALKDIDQAVAWGGKYGIHVCLNFHRAPGYTVAQPAESRVLWTDTEAQEVCAMHWARFARHFKGIPNERLSFNLFNEPKDIDPALYAAVCKKMADANRAEDPDRLIIADGLAWGTKPVPGLRALNVAEATRGYWPMDLTHYAAAWIGGNVPAHPPAWPRPVTCGLLPGPSKLNAGFGGPIVIDGTFPAGASLRLRVAIVSNRARLTVEADGQPVWEHLFVTGSGQGEWKRTVYNTRWKIYQNEYDRDYALRVPTAASELRIAVPEGDWLRLDEIGITPPGGPEDTLTLNPDMRDAMPPLRYQPGALTTTAMQDRATLWRERVKPWRALESTGVGVMVGEWGVYNRTPHDVTLRFMEDNLANWKQAGWGWALWNFRGNFGVMDSGRADVAYEDFEGHKLDRAMLELLQKY